MQLLAEENVIVARLTPLQKQLYHQSVTSLAEVGQDKKKSYLSLMQRLRKICNHPYLLPGTELSEDDNEHLVNNSGKLKILDLLLQRLKQEGRVVEINSQSSRFLDILQDLCILRKFQYFRLQSSIDMDIQTSCSNQEDQYFIYLVNGRNGGRTAVPRIDTYVFLDNDWMVKDDDRSVKSRYRIITEETVQIGLYEHKLLLACAGVGNLANQHFLQIIYESSKESDWEEDVQQLQTALSRGNQLKKRLMAKVSETIAAHQA